MDDCSKSFYVHNVEHNAWWCWYQVLQLFLFFCGPTTSGVFARLFFRNYYLPTDGKTDKFDILCMQHATMKRNQTSFLPCTYLAISRGNFRVKNGI